MKIGADCAAPSFNAGQDPRASNESKRDARVVGGPGKQTMRIFPLIPIVLLANKATEENSGFPFHGRPRLTSNFFLF